MTIVATNPSLTLPNSVGPYGLAGLIYGVNNYAGSRVDITTGGTNTALSAANARNGWIFLNAGATGAFTVTLPATADILALILPKSTGIVGGANVFTKAFCIANNSTGFTGTLTAGDASTTLAGELTIPNLFARWFLLTVTAATTIRIQNIGVLSLTFNAPNTFNAHVGGGQALATPITTYLSRIGSVAGAGDSVLLPKATGGGGPGYTVCNMGNNSMDVFPQVGEQINLLAANTALAQASATSRIFFDIAAGVWGSVG